MARRAAGAVMCHNRIRGDTSMKTVSVRSMRSALARLDDVIAAHGELLLTKRGRPIARIVPLRPTQPLPTHADLRASMPRLARPSEDLLRAERDER